MYLRSKRKALREALIQAETQIALRREQRKAGFIKVQAVRAALVQSSLLSEGSG